CGYGTGIRYGYRYEVRHF
ncbi:hypothetical protein A2U01_0106619, partial [Trifolium medium]|nr:hypothetical protein [Trifolium medium]